MNAVGPRVRRMGDVTWHRPEYFDRRDALVTMAEIAQLAETPLRTVQSWAHVHAATWPRPVMSIATTAAQPRHYYDPSEVVAWLLECRPRAKRGVEPARLERVLAEMDDRIEHHEAEIRHLVAMQSRMTEALHGTPVR